MGIEPLNHLKLPKPVDNLKPLKTIWNQLKPPETFQEVPETTWNRLKPATLYFFFYLRYSQVVLVLILHPKVFFGKNLKVVSAGFNWFQMVSGGFRSYLVSISTHTALWSALNLKKQLSQKTHQGLHFPCISESIQFNQIKKW